MRWMFLPGVALLAVAAYQSLKLKRFLRGAFRVPAEVSWVPGGEDFEHYFQKGNKLAMARDKEFLRRYLFGLWVLIRPPDEEPLEIGIHTGRAGLFKHGDTLEVLYNPKQPQHVFLAGENPWVGLVILGVIGLVVLWALIFAGGAGSQLVGPAPLRLLACAEAPLVKMGLDQGEKYLLGPEANSPHAAAVLGTSACASAPRAARWLLATGRSPR
ncbi:hypothetical protein D7W81_33920 [Corallococcus aberystwythensis]|uniref:DUF3592 domain-containing protein n=2 Tax=Corallococcus aberystwythensis TaxID=2316722 RepID=A0A3A8PJA4_9BACT|nr:hypothetical protein D7W81_33920 [Corallococcus aberystwythensis]